jgi:hypothetical protein
VWTRSTSKRCAQARTDPSFKAGVTPLGLQIFSNPVAPPAATATYMDNEADDPMLRNDATQIPQHCSLISSSDGYKAEAMLFVDEMFANMRVARESSLGNLLWKPVVRFCSTHYKYVRDDDGPRIMQVGIGVDDKVEALQHFRAPPQPSTKVGAAEA